MGSTGTAARLPGAGPPRAPHVCLNDTLELLDLLGVEGTTQWELNEFQNFVNERDRAFRQAVHEEWLRSLADAVNQSSGQR